MIITANQNRIYSILKRQRLIEKLAKKLGCNEERAKVLLKAFYEVVEGTIVTRVFSRKRTWRALPRDASFVDQHIAAHLLETHTYGVSRAPKGIRWLTFDIDKKSEEYAGSVLERYRALKRALGPVPTFPMRSSNSGGIHVHIFLKRHHASREMLTHTVRRLLRANGLALKDGTLEFNPRPQCLRLPFGPGSQVLNERTLHPLALRSKADALSKFIQFSRTKTVEYRTLRRRADALVTKAGAAIPVFVPMSTEEANARLDQPVPALGTRFKLFKEIVRNLSLVQGRTEDQIKTIIETWLRTFKERHVSENLDDDFEGTIQTMLAAVPEYAGRTRTSTNIPYPLQLVTHTHIRPTPSAKIGSWREDATQHLPRIAQLQLQALDPWYRRRLRVLGGLLGYHARRYGRLVTIHSDNLLRLAGGKPPPSRLLSNNRHVRSINKSAYRVLVLEARRLGWLRKIENGVEGKHSNVFQILFKLGRAA